MQASTRVQTANGTSNAVTINWLADPVNVTIAIIISGTATVKAQYTVDDLSGATDATGTGLNWLDHSTLTGLTTSTTGNIAFPVTAVRSVVSGASGGPTVTTTVRQAGNP